MDIPSSDSKTLLRVFDGRRRGRHSRGSTSAVTDSNSDVPVTMINTNASRKPSLDDLDFSNKDNILPDLDKVRSSSPIHNSKRRSSRSPKKYRRSKGSTSLAYKARIVSSPRSLSPNQDTHVVAEKESEDVYAMLENVLKKEKKKQRHSKTTAECVECGRHHEHHRCRHKCRDSQTVPCDLPEHRSRNDVTVPTIDQSQLLETFSKLLTHLQDKSSNINVHRSLSHKSLQCEVPSKGSLYDDDKPCIRSKSRAHSRETVVSRRPSNTALAHADNYKDYKYGSSKKYMESDVHDRRYRDKYDKYYAPMPSASKSFHRDCPYKVKSEYIRDKEREYCDRRGRVERETSHDTLKRRGDTSKVCVNDRTSRLDVKETWHDDANCRRPYKYEHYRDRRYFEDKELRDRKYDERYCRERYYSELDSHCQKHRAQVDRYDRKSLSSRDEDYKDRYSERERDSGMSIADGETSTISGRSNYIKVVKQEIAEQREAMDKMMKLWKDLMKCFKNLSETKNQESSGSNGKAVEKAYDSASAQLQLWRECMQRYETVARDVGDTDARLMEEINRQRAEMNEMASLWQECLQRYRDMNDEFNTLKKQLSTANSAAPQPASAEGEGVPAPLYRPAHNYPHPPPSPVPPIRNHASSPSPPWRWWGDERPPRRQASLDSRGSRERRHRHREKEHHDEPRPRYKEKTSKPNASRSEHRHRKR